MIQKYINGQQIEKLPKKIIKIFLKIGFEIHIKTNFKIIAFLDMTFNLINGSYKLFKKLIDTLLYINKNSKYPPQITNKLPEKINAKLCIFFASKEEYETASKNNGYKNVDFKYNLENKNNNRKNRKRNIIWFNPQFRQTVSKNVVKRYLDFLN